MMLKQTSSFIHSLQTPVILSQVYPELAEGKDKVLLQDNLLRIPPHFDELSVTEENNSFVQQN